MYDLEVVMAADPKPATTFEEMSSAECLALLARYDVGRLAVAAPGSSPLVVPVTYILDRDEIVFRTDAGEKLGALRHQPVSFQIDEFDSAHRAGWSVLVKGVAYEATRWEVAHLAIEPWAPGLKTRWIRVRSTSITGRRIVLPPFEPDARAYL